MKAVVLQKPFEVAIKDSKEPIPSEGGIKIKVEAVGICGSDVAAYRGTSPLCVYPVVIGHEIIGQALDVTGKNEEFQEGDRVVLEPYIPCGRCYPCSIGRTNCCMNLRVLGVHVNGGMSEYFCHPAALAHKIPENSNSLEELALIEPLVIALHAIHRVNLQAGEYVVIMGAGPIGNLIAQAAMNYGGIPIVVDLLDARLDLARSTGVRFTVNPATEKLVDRVKEITDGRMAECVIEATGAKNAVQSVLDLAAFAGRVALVGWPKDEIPLLTRLVTFKELSIYGSRNAAGEFQEAIRLITEKKITVKPLISKVVGMEELPDSLRLLAEKPGDYLKIVGRF